METPFSFGKIVSGKEFTDREKETDWLIQQWSVKTNSMIISPRRWGKSSLVQHASDKFRKKNPQKIFCFIDLFNVRSEQEFYEVFAKEIIRATASGWEEAVRNVKTFFKQLVPKLRRRRVRQRLTHGSTDFAARKSSSADWRILFFKR
jgi:AAA+ ATPase superfamily predicted ATPase